MRRTLGHLALFQVNRPLIKFALNPEAQVYRVLSAWHSILITTAVYSNPKQTIEVQDMVEDNAGT